MLKKQLMKQTSKSSRLEMEVLWQLLIKTKVQVHRYKLSKNPEWGLFVFRSTASKWIFKTSEDSARRTMSNFPTISSPSLKSLRSSSKRSPIPPNNLLLLLKALRLQHIKAECNGDNRLTDSGRPKRKPSKTRTRWSSSVSTRSRTWWRWWKSTRSAQHSYTDVIHPNNGVATSAVVLLSVRASMTGS